MSESHHESRFSARLYKNNVSGFFSPTHLAICHAVIVMGEGEDKGKGSRWRLKTRYCNGTGCVWVGERRIFIYGRKYIQYG